VLNALQTIKQRKLNNEVLRALHLQRMSLTVIRSWKIEWNCTARFGDDRCVWNWDHNTWRGL